MWRIKITLLFLLLAKFANAEWMDNSGAKIGIVYQIGHPAHRIGTVVGFFIHKKALQISGSYRLYYAFGNYGPNIASWEVQTEMNVGIGIGGSQNNLETADMLAAISNFSNRENMISYGVKYYWDEIETQQFTGIIGLRVKNYFLLAENDGLVVLPWDQYRTGAISVGKYFFTDHQINTIRQQRLSLDVLLYTGKTNGLPTQKIVDPDYPARFGYKKLNASKYAHASHGIIRINYSVNLGLGQQAGFAVGVDNEHIRNFVQNKIIHDLPLLPAGWIKIKNPHIPMRTIQGADYLYGTTDTLRQGKFVWELNMNAPYFY